MKKLVFVVIRVLIAVVAMYFALRKINWQELNQFEWSSALLWLLPAVLLFNISQFISAYRLLRFYKVYLPEITYPFNVRLYYKGMFYNLFLPGGIGGDAYKVIALKNENTSYRQLAAATLLDRITGLIVLLLIISVLSYLVPLQGVFDNFFAVLPILTFIGIPIYWLATYRYFRLINKILPLAGVLSSVIQGFQVLSFCCILYAFNITIDSFPEYAFLFFVSSVISALPFSIGGIGTRELAIATGAAYFHFSSAKLVSASLIFFLLTAISALIGWALAQGTRYKAQGTRMP
jgi:glycosyltransferase 2 family protein